MNIEKLDAKSPVESNIVKDFHNKRFLFLIIGNKIFNEKTPSGMSHTDWIKTLDLSEVINPYNSLNVNKDIDFIINNFTRGYYYNNTIVLYTGLNFIINSLVIDNLRYCLDLLIDAFNLANETKVGLGCIPIKNTIFPIDHEIGTIGEIKKIKNFDKLYLLCDSKQK